MEYHVSPQVLQMVANGLLESNPGWRDVQRSLLRTGSEVRSTSEFLAVLNRFLDTLREPMDKAAVLLIGIEYSTRDRCWAEFKRFAKRGDSVIQRLPRRSSLAPYLRGCIALGRLGRAYETGRVRAAKVQIAKLRRSRGYFNHIALTYCGLLELNRDRLKEALVLLQASGKVDRDRMLTLRGYSPALYERLRKCAPDAQELSFYGQLQIGPPL